MRCTAKHWPERQIQLRVSGWVSCDVPGLKLAARPRAPALTGTTFARPQREPRDPSESGLLTPDVVTDMRAAVRFSRGRARYTGRIARASFVAWTESGRGRSALDLVASRIRFALFGRQRAARRRLWREAVETARREAVADAVQRELDAYLARVDTFAYARELPRVGVDLRRLVVVPRLFANDELYRRIDAALLAPQLFPSGGESLRGWFVRMLVHATEAAVEGTRPSPESPLPAGQDWIVVGVDERFEWAVPIEGPGWPGHYYVLELTRRPITRVVRKAVHEAIGHLEASLPSLSRAQRNAIVARS